MSTHTPGPWVYEYRDGNDPRNKRNGWGTEGLWGADNSLIFGTATGWDGGFEAPLEDDAAFIVRACNAHATMLEALKDCLHNAKMRRDSGFECGPTIEREIERTEQAIRLAEGRP